MGEVVLPKAVVAVVIVEEHRPAAGFLVVDPITRVLALQLLLFVLHPERALPVSLVVAPAALDVSGEAVPRICRR